MYTLKAWCAHRRVIENAERGTQSEKQKNGRGWGLLGCSNSIHREHGLSIAPSKANTFNTERTEIQLLDKPKALNSPAE